MYFFGEIFETNSDFADRILLSLPLYYFGMFSITNGIIYDCLTLEPPDSKKKTKQVRRPEGVMRTDGYIMIIFVRLFRFVRSFLNIDPFLMKFVPLESSRFQLSNGTYFIKNGSILRKLWIIRNNMPCIMCDYNRNRNSTSMLRKGVSKGLGNLRQAVSCLTSCSRRVPGDTAA